MPEKQTASKAGGRDRAMALHATVDGIIQSVVFQTVAAGLTATSIAGVIGLVPTIIASAAGLAAITAYSFAVADSPAFQRFWKWLFKSEG